MHRNFDVGDLRSRQNFDLTIKRQWENVQMPFIRKQVWEHTNYLTIFFIRPLSMTYIQF